MNLLLALILAVPLNDQVVRAKNPGYQDGGTLLNVNVAASSASSSSWFPDGGVIGFVKQGTGEDGGRAWNVTTTNPTPAYVNALLDGGFTTAQITNPVSYVNALVDGGSINVVQTTSPWVVGGYVNVLVDGGFVTAQIVAALPAGTNVIGHVISDATSTTAVTQATGTNLHAVLDTTSTTACTQATGTNLHAVLDTTSTTACTQATGTNLHVVTDATSTLAANQSVNASQIAGVAPVMAAASTAAAAADRALVVGLSPNGSNPCLNPSATLVGIAGATSGTASVQLVALSGSTKIYVCSMHITGISGTTPTFKLQYGTGSVCGTGTVGIVGPWTTAANTIYPFNGPLFALTPAGQALCYIQTGTSPVNNYDITYVQQ